MKKALLLVPVALMAFASCNKMETVDTLSTKSEISIMPLNGGVATRGVTTGTSFFESYFESELENKETYDDSHVRSMQISAYLTPQNGEAGNYFVDKTYQTCEGTSDSCTIWKNYDVKTSQFEPIYWPVGGTLNFLAYSLTSEPKYNNSVDVVWDEEDASSKVVLTVPGENAQNDILFSSAYGEQSKNGASPVNMTFKHAQAWIQFQLTGTAKAHDDSHASSEVADVIHFQKIELEDVYNAGVLTIENNKGNAKAKWDFSEETRSNIEVDNIYEVTELSSELKTLNMLIPEQKKTAFVIYYTLGADDQVLSYRFTTDKKTWLMGEKYIYKINITTNEITVEPKTAKWNDVEETTLGDGGTGELI